MIPIDFCSVPDENLLIGSLVSKAAEMYDSYGDCSNRCNHPSGSCNDNFCRKPNCQNCDVNNALVDDEDCQGCCLECSEEVHYHRSFHEKAYRSEYNCQKLVYYYTCRYSWKYCSEIMYALESVDLSKYGTFSALSLGCGQSPDLMAIEQKNRVECKGISYIGYDINPYWTSVHAEIQAYYRNVTYAYCHYETVDIVERLQNGNGGFANVIIMSYLISSFSDIERRDKATQLFDLIISKVLVNKNHEPVLIIINDIDHNKKARDYFDILTRKIKKAGYHSNVNKRHFGNRNGNTYGDGSKQYSSCTNKFAIPDSIKNDFNCAINCTSNLNRIKKPSKSA